MAFQSICTHALINFVSGPLQLPSIMATFAFFYAHSIANKHPGPSRSGWVCGKRADQQIKSLAAVALIRQRRHRARNSLIVMNNKCFIRSHSMRNACGPSFRFFSVGRHTQFAVKMTRIGNTKGHSNYLKIHAQHLDRGKFLLKAL